MTLPETKPKDGISMKFGLCLWLDYERSNEHHIHFICTSNKASGMEMLPATINNLEEGLNNGFTAMDSIAMEEIWVTTPILMLLGDNPMQSEFTSHIGMNNARKSCRKCDVVKKFETANELAAYMKVSSYDNTCLLHIFNQFVNYSYFVAFTG